MYYAIFVPSFLPEGENLIFTDIKEASKTLKKFKGSRMKTFQSEEEALEYVNNGDESFFEDSTQDLVESLEKLNIDKKDNDKGDHIEGLKEFPSVEPKDLNALRKFIEAGNYEEVEKTIWSNPRCLITVCDTAVYLQAGSKYNACHIAARANKPDIMALILDTITNFSFIKKLYPDESDVNIQQRVNHLLDSYLNTPDPRAGNTPLHFACKGGYYKVVRVLLTFEGCDLNLKDSAGLTAEESINSEATKIKDLFKSHLYLPVHRDQLKKRLILEKRRSTGTP